MNNMKNIESNQDNNDLFKFACVITPSIEFKNMKKGKEVVDALKKLMVSDGKAISFTLNIIAEFEEKENIIIHSINGDFLNLVFKKKEYDDMFYNFIMSRMMLLKLEN